MYHVSAQGVEERIINVAIKLCLSRKKTTTKHSNKTFVVTEICLSRQTFRRDKHTFVATKNVFCRYKHTFVATKNVFCRYKHTFVTCGSSRQ